MRVAWGEMTEDQLERNNEIAQQFINGIDIVSIGKCYGITGSRVQQILKRQYGLGIWDGGAHVRAKKRKVKREFAAEVHCQNKHGCTRASYRRVKDLGEQMMFDGETWYRTPIGAFGNGRQHAKDIGAPWLFNFWQWWTIWQKSRKWHLRGRGYGKYRMQRIDPNGPFSPENVSIVSTTNSLNAATGSARGGVADV